MHLGNGAITPACAVITGTIAAVGIAACATAVWRTGFDRRRTLTAGIMGAAVFAAQTINLPILPYSSAHLVGGVLLAWVLGPALAPLVMAVILTLQAALLGDGGLTSLGANFINMGLLPAVLVMLTTRLLRHKPRDLQVALSAVLSIIAAASLIVGEVALLRPQNQLVELPRFATSMISIHAVAACLELLATILIHRALNIKSAPGLTTLTPRRLAGTTIVVAFLLVIALPFASSMPDGYEFAAHDNAMSWLLPPDSAAFSYREVIYALAGATFTGLAVFTLAFVLRLRTPLKPLVP